MAADDDAALDQLWHFNVGSGINAPPMTFEVSGRQFTAIQSGLSRNAININSMTPELPEMRNPVTAISTMLVAHFRAGDTG
jgi:alcohol dehydrogenase (cytochrome c)